jgi:DNA-binding IclR family transcriptional regulator
MKVLFLQVGGRIPLYLGAGPKVLFAYLPDEEIERILSDYKRPALTPFTITESDAIRREIKTIRSRGYSLSFGEKTVGAASIGFPVRDWRGEVVAGINISGFRERFIGDKLSVLIKQVSEAAYEISRRLHFSGSYVNPSIEPLEGPVIHHALGREKET